jgi:hypothetical protein
MTKFSRQREFAFKRKNINTYGCMVVKKTPLYSLYFFAIDIFSWNFVNDINPSGILFDGNRKKQFITLFFLFGDTIVENLVHLKEVSNTLSVFNIK